MRRLILALIVLSTTLPFFAQSKFTIRGRVVDALMRNELPYLLSPFSLIVRSFDQDSFGHLAKFHSVVWPNQHVTSVVLPNPSLQIGFRCPYM